MGAGSGWQERIAAHTKRAEGVRDKTADRDVCWRQSRPDGGLEDEGKEREHREGLASLDLSGSVHGAATSCWDEPVRCPHGDTEWQRNAWCWLPQEAKEARSTKMRVIGACRALKAIGLGVAC